MVTLRELWRGADQTPRSRERVIDLLRGLAIIAVVLGHWSVIAVGYDQDGQLTARSALPDLLWAHPLTWIAQVMPLFFLVGGYANAASLSSARRRGRDVTEWLLQRAGRLIRPTTALVLVMAGAGLAARLLNVDARLVRLAVWFASIPLWFLAVYLVVVALTPLMYALHRRYGLAVPGGLVGLVAIGDIARLYGDEWWAQGNFLFGWLAIHQLGFAWWDGQLTNRLHLAWGLLLGGVTVLLLLTLAGPYPISMINIPGERLHNMSPPSLALLAVASSQLGLVLLLRNRVEQWLHRARPWRLVAAVNAVILTIFLWHVAAAVVLAVALHLLNLLPTSAVGSAAWLAWRIPWLIMLAGVLAVLLAIFGPIETRRLGKPSRDSRWMPTRLGAMLTRKPLCLVLSLTGLAAIVFGLIHNNMLSHDSTVALGLPVAALLAYLAGAALLRLLRAAADACKTRRSVSQRP